MKIDNSSLSGLPKSKKVTAAFVLIAFVVTNLFSVPNALAQNVSTQPAILKSIPISDIKLIEVPGKMGEIQKLYQGSRNKSVILIQDAHAIPDAQASIHKLIQHFQENYGVSLVGVEGASKTLNPQIFKSYPDQNALRKVLKVYHAKGELTGANAAALLSPADAAYAGVEDWPLYEEGLRLYQSAMALEPEAIAGLESLNKTLLEQKAQVYSQQLLDLDRALTSFYDDHANLMQVLGKLSEIKMPEAGSQLALLIEEGRTQGQTTQSLEIEIKRMAAKVRKFLETRKNPQARAAFNGEFQKFNTSQITPRNFALHLKNVVVEHRIPVKASAALTALVRKEKSIRDIQGTALFDELEIYNEDVFTSLITNEAQAALHEKSKQMRTIRKLIQRELTHKDWELLAEGRGAVLESGVFTSLRDSIQANLEFYKNAKQRDRVMVRNLLSQLGKKESSALLVAGGFHTDGMSAILEKAGISYAVLMPRIGSIPEETTYRDQMTGEFSWKDYFEVENGKVSIYNAFVRSTRDKLLRGSGLGTRDSEPSQNPIPDARVAKRWRDQIIRDLADKGEIEKAGEYTRFIDELTGDNQIPFEKIEKRLREKVDAFIAGLRGLESQGQLTQANVLNLIRPATASSLASTGLSKAIVDADVVFNRVASEIRTDNFSTLTPQPSSLVTAASEVRRQTFKQVFAQAIRAVSSAVSEAEKIDGQALLTKLNQIKPELVAEAVSYFGNIDRAIEFANVVSSPAEQKLRYANPEALPELLTNINQDNSRWIIVIDGRNEISGASMDVGKTTLFRSLQLGQFVPEGLFEQMAFVEADQQLDDWFKMVRGHAAFPSSLHGPIRTQEVVDAEFSSTKGKKAMRQLADQSAREALVPSATGISIEEGIKLIALSPLYHDFHANYLARIRERVTVYVGNGSHVRIEKISSSAAFLPQTKVARITVVARPDGSRTLEINTESALGARSEERVRDERSVVPTGMARSESSSQLSTPMNSKKYLADRLALLNLKIERMKASRKVSEREAEIYKAKEELLAQLLETKRDISPEILQLLDNLMDPLIAKLKDVLNDSDIKDNVSVWASLRSSLKSLEKIKEDDSLKKKYALVQYEFRNISFTLSSNKRSIYPTQMDVFLKVSPEAISSAALTALLNETAVLREQHQRLLQQENQALHQLQNHIRSSGISHAQLAKLNVQAQFELLAAASVMDGLFQSKETALQALQPLFDAELAKVQEDFGLVINLNEFGIERILDEGIYPNLADYLQANPLEPGRSVRVGEKMTYSAAALAKREGVEEDRNKLLGLSPQTSVNYAALTGSVESEESKGVDPDSYGQHFITLNPSALDFGKMLFFNGDSLAGGDYFGIQGDTAQESDPKNYRLDRTRTFNFEQALRLKALNNMTKVLHRQASGGVNKRTELKGGLVDSETLGDISALESISRLYVEASISGRIDLSNIQQLNYVVNSVQDLERFTQLLSKANAKIIKIRVITANPDLMAQAAEAVKSMDNIEVIQKPLGRSETRNFVIKQINQAYEEGRAQALARYLIDWILNEQLPVQWTDVKRKIDGIGLEKKPIEWGVFANLVLDEANRIAKARPINMDSLEGPFDNTTIQARLTEMAEETGYLKIVFHGYGDSEITGISQITVAKTTKIFAVNELNDIWAVLDRAVSLNPVPEIDYEGKINFRLREGPVVTGRIAEDFAPETSVFPDLQYSRGRAKTVDVYLVPEPAAPKSESRQNVSTESASQEDWVGNGAVGELTPMGTLGRGVLLSKRHYSDIRKSGFIPPGGERTSEDHFPDKVKLALSRDEEFGSSAFNIYGPANNPGDYVTFVLDPDYVRNNSGKFELKGGFFLPDSELEKFSLSPELKKKMSPSKQGLHFLGLDKNPVALAGALPDEIHTDNVPPEAIAGIVTREDMIRKILRWDKEGGFPNLPMYLLKPSDLAPRGKIRLTTLKPLSEVDKQAMMNESSWKLSAKAESRATQSAAKSDEDIWNRLNLLALRLPQTLANKNYGELLNLAKSIYAIRVKAERVEEIYQYQGFAQRVADQKAAIDQMIQARIDESEQAIKQNQLDRALYMISPMISTIAYFLIQDETDKNYNRALKVEQDALKGLIGGLGIPEFDMAKLAAIEKAILELSEAGIPYGTLINILIVVMGYKIGALARGQRQELEKFFREIDPEENKFLMIDLKGGNKTRGNVFGTYVGHRKQLLDFFTAPHREMGVNDKNLKTHLERVAGDNYMGLLFGYPDKDVRSFALSGRAKGNIYTANVGNVEINWVVNGDPRRKDVRETLIRYRYAAAHIHNFLRTRVSQSYLIRGIGFTKKFSEKEKISAIEQGFYPTSMELGPGDLDQEESAKSESRPRDEEPAVSKTAALNLMNIFSDVFGNAMRNSEGKVEVNLSSAEKDGKEVVTLRIRNDQPRKAELVRRGMQGLYKIVSGEADVKQPKDLETYLMRHWGKVLRNDETNRAYIDSVIDWYMNVMVPIAEDDSSTEPEWSPLYHRAAFERPVEAGAVITSWPGNTELEEGDIDAVVDLQTGRVLTDDGERKRAIQKFKTEIDARPDTKRFEMKSVYFISGGLKSLQFSTGRGGQLVYDQTSDLDGTVGSENDGMGGHAVTVKIPASKLKYDAAVTLTKLNEELENLIKKEILKSARGRGITLLFNNAPLLESSVKAGTTSSSSAKSESRTTQSTAKSEQGKIEFEELADMTLSPLANSYLVSNIYDEAIKNGARNTRKKLTADFVIQEVNGVPMAVFQIHNDGKGRKAKPIQLAMKTLHKLLSPNGKLDDEEAFRAYLTEQIDEFGLPYWAREQGDPDDEDDPGESDEAYKSRIDAVVDWYLNVLVPIAKADESAEPVWSPIYHRAAYETPVGLVAFSSSWDPNTKWDDDAIKGIDGVIDPTFDNGNGKVLDGEDLRAAIDELKRKIDSHAERFETGLIFISHGPKSADAFTSGKGSINMSIFASKLKGNVLTENGVGKGFKVTINIPVSTLRNNESVTNEQLKQVLETLIKKSLQANSVPGMQTLFNGHALAAKSETRSKLEKLQQSDAFLSGTNGTYYFSSLPGETLLEYSIPLIEGGYERIFTIQYYPEGIEDDYEYSKGPVFKVETPEGKRFYQRPGDLFTVGKQEINHYRVAKEKNAVSAVHALFHFSNSQVQFYDAVTKNGSKIQLLNGSRIIAEELPNVDAVVLNERIVNINAVLPQGRGPYDDNQVTRIRDLSLRLSLLNKYLRQIYGKKGGPYYEDPAIFALAAPFVEELEMIIGNAEKNAEGESPVTIPALAEREMGVVEDQYQAIKAGLLENSDKLVGMVEYLRAVVINEVDEYSRREYGFRAESIIKRHISVNSIENVSKWLLYRLYLELKPFAQQQKSKQAEAAKDRANDVFAELLGIHEDPGVQAVFGNDLLTTFADTPEFHRELESKAMRAEPDDFFELYHRLSLFESQIRATGTFSAFGVNKPKQVLIFYALQAALAYAQERKANFNRDFKSTLGENGHYHSSLIELGDWKFYIALTSEGIKFIDASTGKPLSTKPFGRDPRGPITIGSNQDNILVLDGVDVSANHARVEVAPGYKLVDLNLDSATYAAGKPISSLHLIFSETEPPSPISAKSEARGDNQVSSGLGKTEKPMWETAVQHRPFDEISKDLNEVVRTSARLNKYYKYASAELGAQSKIIMAVFEKLSALNAKYESEFSGDEERLHSYAVNIILQLLSLKERGSFNNVYHEFKNAIKEQKSEEVTHYFKALFNHAELYWSAAVKSQPPLNMTDFNADLAEALSPGGVVSGKSPAPSNQDKRSELRELAPEVSPETARASARTVLDEIMAQVLERRARAEDSSVRIAELENSAESIVLLGASEFADILRTVLEDRLRQKIIAPEQGGRTDITQAQAEWAINLLIGNFMSALNADSNLNVDDVIIGLNFNAADATVARTNALENVSSSFKLTKMFVAKESPETIHKILKSNRVIVDLVIFENIRLGLSVENLVGVVEGAEIASLKKNERIVQTTVNTQGMEGTDTYLEEVAATLEILSAIAASLHFKNKTELKAGFSVVAAMLLGNHNLDQYTSVISYENGIIVTHEKGLMDMIAAGFKAHTRVKAAA